MIEGVSTVQMIDKSGKKIQKHSEDLLTNIHIWELMF